MQFGLFAVLVLILMDIADSSKVVKGRRHKRRSAEMSPNCDKGCVSCSEFNGCIKCSPRLFILLERSDIRQRGVCFQSCPPGYYDDRGPDMNTCIKCKVNNCENCFSKTFCTKCNDGFYLHKGACYSTCPEGFTAANGTMECSSVQCEMSEWGPWGPCTRPAKCGKKKGTEERSRKVLKAPLGEASLCPATTERRKCTLQVLCPKENKKKGKNQNQGKGKKEKNKEKGGNKKKKNQQRGTSMPITPSIPSK
ncbi:R-spondin-1 [Gastrophryne carolinensis]